MPTILDKVFFRENHTCPMWFCFTFDNPLRALFQNPLKILAPFVQLGFTALDIGPGQGYFTFPMAALVSDKGKVIALDIQKNMLDVLRKNAERKGCSNVVPHLYDGKRFGITDPCDFALLFWMFHEVQDKDNFLRELKQVCKQTSKILLAEPIIHVSGTMFEESKRTFEKHGFKTAQVVQIGLSRALVFEIQN